jgi:pseudaminic acid synthase
MIKIADFPISNENSTFIVAELSANHNGSLEKAIKTIRAAKHAGADAIKLQTYTADTITLDCKTDHFRIKQGTLWDGKYLYDLYKEAYTPWEWHAELFKVAKEEGIICFSTPFDNTAVDFLENLNTPAYKIASFEITDIPLIQYVASKGKPVIISTGIAGINDIEMALDACKEIGNDQLILLKCTSSYPAPIEDANLIMIPDMARRFGTIIGLSDHTLGDNVAIAAVALGAKIIEKHFIIDRKVGSPDSQFSMEPNEFQAMVNSIRSVEQALGKVSYDISINTRKNLIFSRSIFVVKDIIAGEVFTAENIRSIRPGNGLHPKYLKYVLGKQSVTNLSKGTPLSWEHIIR